MAFSAPDPGDEPTSVESPRIDPHDGAHARNPWLAVLGAGDAAVSAVARAVTEAFSAAGARQKTVQQRVADLPGELDEVRARFSGDELRRALDDYRAQLERAYAGFAGRGEEAWGRLRERPDVRQAITALESYTEKLDTSVDGLVDDAQGAASRALAAAGRQTRTAGERVARTGQRFSGRAADAVVDASAATAEAVEDAGTRTAEAIEEAGDDTAAVTRKATRKTAPRTAPRNSGPASE